MSVRKKWVKEIGMLLFAVLCKILMRFAFFLKKFYPFK